MLSALASPIPMRALLAGARRSQPALLDLLRKLVLAESPSDDKAAVDACVSLAAGHAKALGGRVRIHRQRALGNVFEARFGPRTKGNSTKPVLLLGHLDTVWPLGTLRTMPWREHRGRLYGPGVFDMKSGIVQMMFALWALHETAEGLPRPVIVLLVSDEEQGSSSSRRITEKLAQRCAAVLVCEPSGPGGALKTARKGVGGFRLKVTGHAAHSGLDFEKGHSAILELAHQVRALSGLTDLKRGITLNVGVIRGGTRTNVIAAEAIAEVDLRVARKSDGAVMERRVRRLRAVNPNCTLHIEGGINRPPLERTKHVAALFEKAREVARELGFKLNEITVGGGSDGNFTAGIGIPTLDGLGAVGDGAHASHEHVIASELPRRAALLAGLIGAIE